ncbi:DUF421 domain-containing protein [Loktanella sp. DJP18]|uniref:DUF421 domain-containing protein n=1 Tax=Loktanella sp. DJP18 TaxID=3409788 RepID=UPI003BB62AF4
MDDPVIPFDLARMFFGTDPILFYLEIVFRTCVVYAYALILIRWVGGRGIGQMSAVEFLLVIALGSAVGDAMFYPDVPLFQAMLVITVVVSINKLLDLLIYRYSAAEKFVDGETVEIIRNGVINVRSLRRTRIGKNELFASLREQGVVNLGEVRKAYLESSGRFSVFQSTHAQSGLPIEPAWDVCPPPTYDPGTAVNGKALACCNCGVVISPPVKVPTACLQCGGIVWTSAIVAP